MKTTLNKLISNNEKQRMVNTDFDQCIGKLQKITMHYNFLLMKYIILQFKKKYRSNQSSKKNIFDHNQTRRN